MSSPEPETAPAPDISHLVTEDDTPVDNWFCEKQRRLLVEPLHTTWPGPGPGRSFLAAADVGLFLGVHKPPLVPDAFLSLDVAVKADYWAKQNRSYFIWELGKAPEVVIEVVSGTEGGELTRKVAGYAEMRIPLYVVFDPQRFLSDRVLRLFELRWVRYQEVPVERRITHELLTSVDLSLTLWSGDFETFDADWLRWADFGGSVVETGAERARREADRAQREAARAQRLADRLRALGIDPDTDEPPG